MMRHSVAIVLKSLAKIWQHLPHVIYWKKIAESTTHMTQYAALGEEGFWATATGGGDSKVPAQEKWKKEAACT